MDFKDLKINDNMINVLKQNGIESPTPIQEKSILPIMYGRDIIAQAKTGTGKTLAFLLPIFEQISTDSKNVQALILTPTRELALQITEEAKKLSKAKEINILAAYGGKDISGQINKLKGNVQLVIATPGRLLDHINRKTIDLSKLKMFILDEADQMLFIGFKNEIEAIMKETPKNKQNLCFSATIDSQVKKLMYRYMVDPEIISIDTSTEVLPNIKQEIVETTDRKKLDALVTTLKEDNPFMSIIFCRTKRRVDKLDTELKQRGFNCDKIHSDISQAKRENTMKSFRNLKVQYLIATDVASRGLDIGGVDSIYNYDIPEQYEDYIHRMGRTGRSGEKGYTCTFISPKNNNMLYEIEKRLGFKIDRREV
ncbi:MAG: DEAD/DEAH box helicase [Clostridioides difficile]|nr:DEAD/DEAH box helicase [Clostridioides sp.]MBS5786655.1 DEAD/DEAH box helicase [Clostridioides difficile]